MTDKKSSESRRRLLKTFAAGGGAIVAGNTLPEKWTKPVVDSVMLPTHAETSPQDTQPQVTRLYESTQSADACRGSSRGPAQTTDLNFDVSGLVPASLGTVEATICGDIGDDEETYTVSIEGTTLGQIGPGPNDNSCTSRTFSNVDLTAAAADGTITITFTPDTDEIDCEAPFPNTVEATLSFTAALAN